MKKLNFDSIIFDMDGVLISNSSYCKATSKTVEFILWEKFKLNKKITTKYIEAIKGNIGFNNDWDVSYELVRLLAKGVKLENIPQEVQLITLKIRQSRQYQKIKDIFQAFYLGNSLFQQIYNYCAPLISRVGLISLETLLIDLETLAKLAAKYSLGIATSRPRFEALFAAKNLQITPNYISETLLIAKEDVTSEKPEPEPLLEVKRRMKATNPIYIGDTVNDVVAAKKSDMPCIFVGTRKLGDFQVSNVNQIKEILL